MVSWRTRRFVFSKQQSELRQQSQPIPGSDLPWQEWLLRNFPHVCTHPFAGRHIRLWEWFESLTPGTRPRPRVEVWPRGGAKSSTGELGTARVGAKLTRRFVLYVSGTQEQADKHVQTVGSLFEALGVDRAVNRYGHSRGWRRDQLRTANGFNVSALGLDVAVRGVKLDQYRPDLIIFDDIDSQDDSLKTVAKKAAAITTAIIPAGSYDCALLFLQNLIHEEGIVSQLVDGRADFLHNREVPPVEPAVVGMQVKDVPQADGSRIYRIVAGTPTWAGQNLATCEAQISDWGLRAFKREAQQEVAGADGYVFDVSKLNAIDPADVPPLVSVCLAWDLAGTEGGGDWTVGYLLGKAKNATYYVLAVVRGQWASDRVRGAIKLTAAHYKGLYPGLKLRLPQDPGQAGKDQATQFRTAFKEFRPIIETVTGDKATRASGSADEVNKGNFYFVNQDLPDFLTQRTQETGFKPLMEDLSYPAWHRNLREEMRTFREDETDQVDDQIDAGADAFNEQAGQRGSWDFS